MQVQNRVWGPAIMTVITAVANVPINIVLIKYYDFWGAAVATSVARVLLLILLLGMFHAVFANHPVQSFRSKLSSRLAALDLSSVSNIDSCLPLASTRNAQAAQSRQCMCVYE